MKPFILVTFLICFLNCLSIRLVDARPGETVTQCDKRYGKPLHVESDLRIYSKAGVDLGVFFRNKVAWQVVYNHINGVPLTTTEKQAILGAYGKWIWTNQDSTGKTWESPDGSLIAVENTANGTFLVTLKKEAQRSRSEASDSIRRSL